MTKSTYTDLSLPPLDESKLTYERGDGARITLHIDRSSVVENKIVSASPVVPVQVAGPVFIQVEDPPPQELRVTGPLTGRGNPRTAAQAPNTPPPSRPANSAAIFDHPTIGGKFTIFVLLYGDYAELHRRCLDAIMRTVPVERADIRVGSNQLCEESLGLIRTLQESGRISLHYRHATNDRKYPVMREMFWDEKNPITTNYLIWFDDDTICDRNADWLHLLAVQIVGHHDSGHRLYGPHYIFKLSAAQIEWIKQADWYKGRLFCDAKGREVPNGDKAHFATGSFWAMQTAAMRSCNVPDPRIGHNGGDYMIGEQLHQSGFKLCRFSQNKQIVNWSSVPRRGLNEPHTGKT